MKISHRPIALSVASALALLSIGAVGVHGLHGARTRLDDHPTNDLRRLENALADIDGALTEHRAALDILDTAARTARASLREAGETIERSNAALRDVVVTLERLSTDSRRRSERDLVVERRGWETYALLGEMEILVHAVDALDSTFRLDPLRARIMSTLEAFERASAPERGADRPSLPLPDSDVLQEVFVHDEHALLTLRTAMLRGRSGVEHHYRRARAETLEAITDGRETLSRHLEVLGSSATAGDRLDGAAAAPAPANALALGRQLASGIGTLELRLEQLLVADADTLATAYATAGTQLDELETGAVRLATLHQEAGSVRPAEGARETARDIDAALGRARETIGTVHVRRREMLDAARAIGASLDTLGSPGEYGGGSEARTDAVSAASETVAAATRRLEATSRLVAALSVVAALGSLAAGSFAFRAIRARLSRLSGLAEALSTGRLDPPVTDGAGDELTPVIGVLNRTAERLDGTLGHARTLAERLATGVTTLARDAEPPASDPSHDGHPGGASGSLERLADFVTAGAHKAERADELSRTASEVAGRGRHAVNEAMRSMRDIEDGAREISSISAVIDSIAFQTNILALNAAVEASRAGESGRGFAVVASEVGSLAQKSKESVLQIRQIIDKNVEHVESGSTLVAQAERHMEEVVGRVDEVVSLIGEVSSSNRRQVEQITRIDDSVGELEHRVRQHALGSERTQGVMHDLLERSRLLEASVGAFTPIEPDTVERG